MFVPFLTFDYIGYDYLYRWLALIQLFLLVIQYPIQIRQEPKNKAKHQLISLPDTLSCCRIAHFGLVEDIEKPPIPTPLDAVIDPPNHRE